MILAVNLDGAYRWQCDDCGTERNEYPHRGPRNSLCKRTRTSATGPGGPPAQVAFERMDAARRRHRGSPGQSDSFSKASLGQMALSEYPSAFSNRRAKFCSTSASFRRSLESQKRLRLAARALPGPCGIAADAKGLEHGSTNIADRPFSRIGGPLAATGTRPRHNCPWFASSAPTGAYCMAGDLARLSFGSVGRPHCVRQAWPPAYFSMLTPSLASEAPADSFRA